MEINKIYNLGCLEGLKMMADNSVDCCVTSPPYFGLRDYGTDEQIGLEETPELFVAALVDVFTEVKRVLKNEGTLWLNLGDSYSSQGGGQVEQTVRNSNDYVNAGQSKGKSRKAPTGLKPKDLIGIPWMVAFALRSSGWYLRQDIIWHKPNPMPESVTDRCTKSHEYIFLLSKSSKYYYDHESIKTEIQDSSVKRLLQNIENQNGSSRVPGKKNGNMKAVANGQPCYQYNDGHSGYLNSDGTLRGNGMANKKSVWTVTTKPFSEAHFATFPQDLIVDCIKAGCPEGGTVLDPFMGAGTTALVAKKLDRNYIGFELNQDYIKIAEKRLYSEIGMFL
jgi:DNA modification methylase